MSELPVIRSCPPISTSAMSEEDAIRLEQVFKALADRHRIRIINCLIRAEMDANCVCDFEELLSLRQSSVSYHLKQLLTAGIVEREKRGSFMHYRLAPGALETFLSDLRAQIAA
jgi:ArsR family transcriptional regulator